MLGRTDRRPRLVALLLVLLLAAGGIGARLAYWQISRAPDLQAMAVAQLGTTASAAAQRGSIYDRTGKVLLATTGYRDNLVAYPDRIPAARRAAIVARLATILALDATARGQLAATLATGSYVVVARAITAAQSDAVRTGLAAASPGGLVGLELEPQAVRLYPNAGGAPGTTLASHLLGFVNREGRGQYGVEQRYQVQLAGAAPAVRPAVAGIANAAGTSAPTGSSLRLTIDASLQLQVEKEVYAAWVGDAAAEVSVVVLDPNDGAVLAWASAPGYDANAYQDVARAAPGRFIDPIISQPYEPGSVMKMFLAAAALQDHVVTPQTLVDDSRTLKIGAYHVDNADKKGMGLIPFADVIAYSRNIGVAKVARELGATVGAAATTLYAMWSKLGVGQRTGVDVAGEVPAVAVDPARRSWAAIDLANRSFGQGMTATPIQLATGYAPMVNGGRLVQPHVVAAVDGTATRVMPGAQVLDPALATQLRDMMVHVTRDVPHYAAGSLIPGFTVGGKTGTAQIWDTEHGQWFTDRYNFSFVGFVGQSRPAAVIAVRIGIAKPLVKKQGDFKLSIASYELFRRIALQVIHALDIPAGPIVPQPTPTQRPR